MSHQYCDVCGRLLDENGYYRTNNLIKYPTGRLSTCKKCVTRKIDNLDPQTFLPILEDIDVPYIKHQWDGLLEIAKRRGIDHPNGMYIMGRYLAKMRLMSFKNYRWVDTTRLEEEYNRLMQGSGI